MLNEKDEKKMLETIIESSRTKEIADYRAKHKKDTLQSVADALGLTKERVRQCCVLHGVPTKNSRYGSSKIESICPQCGGKKSPGGKLCRKCHHINNTTELTCKMCGTKFRRKNSTLKKDMKNGKDEFFCTTQCWGKYVGENFGFGSNKDEKETTEE